MEPIQIKNITITRDRRLLNIEFNEPTYPEDLSDEISNIKYVQISANHIPLNNYIGNKIVVGLDGLDIFWDIYFNNEDRELFESVARIYLRDKNSDSAFCNCDCKK